MNLSSGIDTIEVARLDEIPLSIRERFIERVFTTNEISQAGDRSDMLSGIFAAKEAASKALGTGIGYVRWQDLEILHLPSGQPTINLKGNAQRVAEKRGLITWSVSISHDRNKAVAVVVAIGD